MNDKFTLKVANYFLNEGTDPEERIVATDTTIKKIVKQEIAKYGNRTDLNHVDVSRVTNMCGMFDETPYNGDLSKWNVSKVRDMHGMFRGTKFTGDISHWDVSSVTDMNGMFSDTVFNGDISKWKTKRTVMG